jgi:hypothetical protein
MSPLATVINFCTNDTRFIKACIGQCRIFSNQIILPICDHFFDGEPENQDLLKEIFSSFPDCHFILYPFFPKLFSSTHFWHSASRAIATHFLQKEIETVLFLDADEVPDGVRFLDWVSQGKTDDVMKFANYWYFREERFQAVAWEDSPVFVKRKNLEISLLLHERERDAIYDGVKDSKQRMVLGLDGRPMFHHYSWVRSKEEMLKKVETWGHSKDRDWKKLIEEEFSHPFQGKDFIHGYSYLECESFLALPLEPNSRFTGGVTELSFLSKRKFLKFISKISP